MLMSICTHILTIMIFILNYELYKTSVFSLGVTWNLFIFISLPVLVKNFNLAERSLLKFGGAQYCFSTYVPIIVLLEPTGSSWLLLS